MPRKKPPSSEESSRLFDEPEPSSASSTAAPTPSPATPTSTGSSPEEPSPSSASALEEEARALFSELGWGSGRRPAPSPEPPDPLTTPYAFSASPSSPVEYVEEALSPEGPGYVVIRSRTLKTTVLWTRDKEVKVPTEVRGLIRYTQDELDILQNFTEGELCGLHAVKAAFEGTLYGLSTALEDLP